MSRANVHREVLADCQGAARVRAGANAIAATTEGVVDMEEGVCDTTQPLVPDGPRRCETALCVSDCPSSIESR